MFERFTDAARRVVVGAQAEASALNHNYIGTEHLLLGMLRDGTGAAVRLLALFEGPIDEIRQRVEAIIGRGGGSPPSGHIPFTPRAKKVLELSLREAIQMGDNFIGSEHVLLGLLREGEGVGAQVLAERGVTRVVVWNRLREIERETAPEVGESERDPEAVAEQGLIEIPADDFAQLVAEVARLRDLLRHHGIDPDENPPSFGGEGGAPVA